MASSSTDRRFGTPDRKPAEKRRGPGDDGEDSKFRCTVDSPDGSMPDESDEQIDTDIVATKKMKETEKVDNHIIASVILVANITEVYSPERVSEAAQRHGLVPGSSLDVTKRVGFHQARAPPRRVEKDQDRGSVPRQRVAAMHPVQCVTRVKQSESCEQAGPDGRIREEKSRGN